MSKRGKLLVIEGLEGAGKSTAVQTLTELLAGHNIKTIHTREPGGTPVGEILRTIVKNPEYKESLESKTELLLLYASRIQLVQQIIKPALEQGVWVIADRFELSTFAYQGGGRGLDLDFIQSLSAFCLEGFEPDLTIFLDINPKVGMQRANLRGKLDRIEQQSIAFFQAVYETYKDQIEHRSNMLKIDASLKLDEVQKAIREGVGRLLFQ